jgi:hypothetical protein
VVERGVAAADGPLDDVFDGGPDATGTGAGYCELMTQSFRDATSA